MSIYVDNDSDPSKPCSSVAPRDTQYTEDVGCGNVYVGGHSSVSLTSRGQERHHRHADAERRQRLDWDAQDGLVQDDDSVMLGLIANNFVRVGHRVDGSQ